MITLVIEALYALVFLHSFVTYLRRRDPVRRDLTLVFVPLTSLLVLEVARRALGVAELPMVPAYVAVTLLLAQPYLTLRLVRTVRPVPRWIGPVAFGIFVATTVPFYFLGQQKIPLVTLAMVMGFFVVQGSVAVLLAGEARRRTGAPRARLALAAAATAVLGLCLLVSGAGGSAGRAERVMQITAQVLALLSGVSYMVAFMPPKWLRRVWAGGAAYRVHRQIVDAPADEPPQQTWQRYAVTVREASGAAAAVVLLPTGTDRVGCMACSGDALGSDLTTTLGDLDDLLERPQPMVVQRAGGESPVLDFARRGGAQVVLVVPVKLPTPARGALVLLSRRHPMFVEDDVRLLGELGTQAAILAERGAVAEAIRTANDRLEQRVQERTAELRLAQSALEDVNRRLEVQNVTLAQSNERLQRFAYVASHDLQEPLRKIISFSGLLVERMPAGADADATMYVDRIVGSATRMKRLIEDLLMFSRIGATAEQGPVDCAVAVRSVLDSLDLALAEAHATVTHDDPLPVVLANRMLLEMLFQNLIGNAVKYRSEAPPRIHIAAEELDGQWRVAVTDNGIGFDMTYAERVFQVFQRLHPRGQYEGTGIGLAVCQRIVEFCGGRIGVDSVPGAGSTFWFTLPAAQPHPTRERTDAVAHAAA
jgi:signal transduction histidine kinase